MALMESQRLKLR